MFSPPQVAIVAEGCAKAEPTRGELWCRVAKRVANRRCDVSELLLRVSCAVDDEGHDALLS